MKNHKILILLLSLTLHLGCGSAENQYAVLLVGAKSTPDFDDVPVNVDLVSIGEELAVFGYGDLGEKEWGELTCRFSYGEPHSFRRGGVIVWSPPNANFEEIFGEASVELFAYLISMKAKKEFDPPSSAVVTKKSRIPPGPFNLKIE